MIGKSKMTSDRNPDNLSREESESTRETVNNSNADTENISTEQALKVLFIDNPPDLMRGYPPESYYPTTTEDNHIGLLGLNWNNSAIEFEWDEKSCEVSAYMFHENRENVSDDDIGSENGFYKIWFHQNMPYWEGRRPSNPWGDSVAEKKSKNKS